MKIRSLIVAVSLLAGVSAAQAQAGIKIQPDYSGAMQLSTPLIIKDGQATAFEAILHPDSSPKRACRVSGKVWSMLSSAQSDKRVLVVEQGSVTVTCEGRHSYLVFGNFIHPQTAPAWEPPQKAFCLRPVVRNSCPAYGTLVDAGTQGGWGTWHVIRTVAN